MINRRTENYFCLIILSLAFLMSVGACRYNDSSDKEGVRKEVKDKPSAANPSEELMTDSSGTEIEDTINSALPKNTINDTNNNNQESVQKEIYEIQAEISTLYKFVYAIAGFSICLFLFVVILYYKLRNSRIDIRELYRTNDGNTKDLQYLKRQDKQATPQRTTNAIYNKSQLEADIKEILNKWGFFPSSSGADINNYEDYVAQERGKKNREQENQDPIPVSSIPKKQKFFGMPINDCYLREEERGNSNCFAADCGERTGFIRLISLDRIKSDNISRKVLDPQGSISLQDATEFEIIEGTGKITKVESNENTWKVEIPLIIKIK